MSNRLRLISLIFLVFSSSINCKRGEQKCEEITIPLCVGIGYNYTKMPNQFNHMSQHEAGLEAHQFIPLVKIDCSPYLKFLLCSMYVPICLKNYHKPLPACRSVCLKARRGCEPIMERYGFFWPKRMDCNKLPVHGDSKNLCMPYNATERPRPPKCPCRCEGSYVSITSKQSALYNQVKTGGVLNCAESCHSAYFKDDEKTFASFWIGLWGALCCISTFMTVSTFLVDRDRFRYPERPIVFLSASYLLVSIGYLIRLIVGHERIACDGKVLRYGSTGPALCTVVFFLTYAGANAASVWWVILTFTWFLAAGIKWGQEAISSYATYFHITAWFIPIAQTIAILSLSLIDGDPVAGICSVGNTSLASFRGFLLAPQLVYLMLGSVFLLAGFMSLFRIRSVIKAQGRSRTDKLEKLMIRIGVFSVLYTLPAAIVIGCLFYEERERLDWQRSINCDCVKKKKPDFSVFMLKYFMQLVVGTTSGFWIWTSKTLDSWRKCLTQGLCCRRQRELRDGSVRSEAKYAPYRANQVKLLTSLTNV